MKSGLPDIREFLIRIGKRKYLGFFPAAAAACVAAATALFWTNAGVIIHADEWTERYISSDEAVIVSDEDEGTADIVFNDPDGVYINKFVFDTASAGGEAAEYTVYVYLKDSEPVTVADKNSVYAPTEVINLDREGITGISVRGPSPGSACNFRVDNTLNKNLRAVFIAAIFGAALMKLLIYIPLLMRKTELVFLTIALSAGIALVVALPATKVGYDEETHLQGVLALSAFPETTLSMSHETLWQLTVTVFNDPEALPGSKEETTEVETALDTLCDYREGEAAPTFYVPLSRVPAYFTMAAAARISAWMKVSWTHLLRIVRLANLLTYSLLMYFAIKFLPRRKELLMFIALLPQVIFMASTCSYDPFVIGTTALSLSLLQKGRRFFAPALVFMMLGVVVKAVYAPLILLFVPAFLPGTGREGSGGMKKFVCPLIAGAAFLILLAVFILPTVINPPDMGDLRGGSTSELLQIAYIFSHPIAYLILLAASMLSWLGRCFCGPDCMTFMGHLVNGSTAFRGYYPVYMAMLLVIIALSYVRVCPRDLRDEEPLMTFSGRLFRILMVIFSSALIWTAMFVAFTEPGAGEIAGVQGRYFIPLMFPLYYALSGSGPAAKSRRLEDFCSVCYYLLEFAEFFMLFVVIWKVAVSAFCL